MMFILTRVAASCRPTLSELAGDEDEDVLFTASLALEALGSGGAGAAGAGGSGAGASA